MGRLCVALLAQRRVAARAIGQILRRSGETAAVSRRTAFMKPTGRREEAISGLAVEIGGRVRHRKGAVRDAAAH